MNHFAKRALALALALLFTFTLSAGALAEGPEGTEGAGETTGSDETIPASASNVTVTPGTATLSTTHIYVPFTIVNNSDEAVELNSVRNCNSTEKDSLFEDENSSHQFNKEIPAKSTKQILLMYRYEQNHPDSATYTLGLKFKSITTPSNTFEVYEDISVNFGINVGGDDAGGNNTPGGDTTETVDPPFRLSSYDAEGNLVPAPPATRAKAWWCASRCNACAATFQTLPLRPCFLRSSMLSPLRLPRSITRRAFPVAFTVVRFSNSATATSSSTKK